MQTTFTDNNSSAGLVTGALYCYRLVAVFTLPAGGKSYVTTEQCLGPIITDAPVITHVSVEETDKAEGVIRVSWRSPFDIDKTLFPEPYQYHVYRGNGFTSSEQIFKVGEVVNDTSFQDHSRNTVDSVYNYRLVIYSKPDGYSEFIPVDTSSAASSTRLMAASGDAKIQIDWSAVVPWSNIIDGSPYHYIFRGSKNDADLTFLAKADVTEKGFVWEDESVNPNEYYCYTIMTRGSYGNPAIDTLRNYSHRVCLYPKNDLPPCVPIVAIEQTNCDDFLNSTECDIKFKNNLSWIFNEESGCRIDIVSYNVYSGDNIDDLELSQTDITVQSYEDSHLPSFAKCYKVASVDSQGHESELSETVCNDNCAFYDLPNVFTPEVRDGCNDTFRAVKNFAVEDSQCGSVSCLHFIQDVSINVYDRWGKEVYSSRVFEGLPLNIDWNGTGNDGDKLGSGVYYYWIEVEFDVLEVSKKFQTIKGWVHLVR
jgi:flagellar hook assembly protein FlgD